jgi:hypothetical protein
LLDEDRPAAEKLGDTLFSPFVAAGWNAASERNIRPAQWLGMLKLIGIWGAEFYYSGFFSLGAPFPESQNWCYQAAVPAYAQAVSSSYADLLFDPGSHPVLAGFQGAYNVGRENTFGPNPALSASPWLWAGAPNRIAIARKAAAKELYVIAAAVERKSNQIGNARALVNVSILLPTGGASSAVAAAETREETKLRFEARLQGSVYVYDATDAINKKFYQLDAWHEATHPSYWSKSSSIIEAEVFHSHLSSSSSSSLAIHTEVPPGTAAGDYRVFTSFVATCAVGSSQLTYDVKPASWVWLRVRLSAVCASASANASLSAPVRVGDSNVHWVHAETEWTWTRVSRSATSSPDQPQQLRLSLGGSTALDVDQLVVTEDGNFSPFTREEY